MDFRRLIQVSHYAWKQSKDIAVNAGKGLGYRMTIYIDMMSCFLKYRMWTNQYVAENFCNKSKSEREEIGRRCAEEGLRRDNWQKDFRENRNFLIKYANIKYEKASLRRKREKAYTERYHAGKNFFVEYDVNISRQHYLDGTISIGDNVLLAKHVFIDYSGFVEIGDNVSISDGVMIESHEHPNHLDPMKSKSIVKQCHLEIEKGAFIGVKAVVLGSCNKIGRFSRISANALVTQDVPPYAVVSGNPAKIAGFIYDENQILTFEKSKFAESERLSVEYIQQMFKKYRRTLNKEQIVPNPINNDKDLVKRKVREIVSSVLGYTLLSTEDSTDMDDIVGWGSLANMTIIAELEEEFKIHIVPNNLFRMTSVQAIADVIKQLKTTYKENSEKIDINLNSNSPLWRGICENAVKMPDKLALKIKSSQLTYSELYYNTCKAASFLKKEGIKKGDRIILTAKKEFDFICFYFASHIIGSINVILDPECNEERRKLIEERVQPSLCIGGFTERCKSFQYRETGYDRLPLTQLTDNEFNDGDVAEILFTTGTTGSPKGVCLTYANIYGSACNINDFIKNTCDDREVIGLPICHSFAMGRLRCSLLKGASVFLLENFGNVQKFFDILERDEITGFGMVPAVWEYIYKMSGEQISRYKNQIRYIEIGSSSMTIQSKEKLLQILPYTRICMHYGLTEASRSTFVEFHDTEHLNSIGKSSSKKVSVKIFDSQGKELPCGNEGEICVKGNMVMPRYLEEKDNVCAFFDGFFRTGDRGYEDSEGYFYLVGREKEMINVGGKKVSPLEVEDAICELGVSDCMCVGIPDKKGVLGEVVKAYILDGGTNLSFAEIAERLSSKMERYKCPVEYEYIKEIPMTDSGKKKRVGFVH